MRLSEIVLVWWNSLLFRVSFTCQLVKADGHPSESKLHSHNQNWKMLICACKWAAHQLFCLCLCLTNEHHRLGFWDCGDTHNSQSDCALISWRECLFWLTHVWFVCRERKRKDCCSRLEIAEETWEIQRCKQKIKIKKQHGLE